MQRISLLLAILLLTGIYSFSQEDSLKNLSFNGFYIAKTGALPNGLGSIHTYLRFYKDGTVYSQAVTANEPQAVSSWFGRYKKFSQKGNYQIKGSTISIRLDNKESEDFRLEGAQQTAYTGTIKPAKQLCLTKTGDSQQNCFEFFSVLDSTRLKYAPYKREILLPGEWRVKQILKNNGQVFFINEDSTIVAIAVFEAVNLPVYKKTQNDFETAFAYYEWDSNYMRDEEKMQVKKITEDKDKAFVIWNAKDEDNDNYHLFAKHGDLLFNIMIYDPKMAVDRQLMIIRLLYDINKEPN